LRSQFPINRSALRWLEVILSERFGCKWQVSLTASCLRLKLEGADGAIVFDALEEGFTQARSDLPFTQWNSEREGWHSVLGSPLPVPGVSRLPTPLIEKQGGNTYFHYDVLGLTFWMLARVEEIGRSDLDLHGRFPSTSSHAYMHDYLDRPLVDEWLYVLGQVIVRQWEGVELRRHFTKNFITCDLDVPYAERVSLKKLPRKLCGDLAKRQSMTMAWRSLSSCIRYREPSFSCDPNLAAINWMMDINELAGNKITFFILTGGDHPLDGHYRMDDPIIREILQRIHSRGHDIGLHPGYASYLDSKCTAIEAARLRFAMEAEGISQPEVGSRQHFLRWCSSYTSRSLEKAGLQYDSTLGYADHPGFRCGTCYEFPMFDPTLGRCLELRQRPLVLMECSVIEKRYMGLGCSREAETVMHKLKEICQRVGGVFTMLWHNSNLLDKRSRSIYQELVR
jgi:hypothetical protein